MFLLTKFFAQAITTGLSHAIARAKRAPGQLKRFVATWSLRGAANIVDLMTQELARLVGWGLSLTMYLIVACVIMVLCTAQVAHAQTAVQSIDAPSVQQYMAATSDGDLSTFVFRSIIGGFWDSPTSFAGGASTIMGVFFLVLNAAIFSIGAAWMTYGIGCKILSTATSGEAFGGRGNVGAWLPIRYTIGISGIIPIFGGFSLGQVALVTAAGLGVGVCNFASQKVLASTSGFVAMVHPDLAHSSGTATSLKDAAQKIFMYEVCTAASAEQQRDASAAAVAVPLAEQVQEAAIPVDQMGFSSGYALGFGSANQQSSCGQVAVGAAKKASTRSASTWTGDFRSGAVNYDAIAQAAGSAAVKAYSAGLSAFVADIKAVAVKWRNDRAAYNRNGMGALPQIDMLAINRAMTKYATSIQAGMDTAANTVKAGEGAISEAAVAKLKDQGWLGMGGWFATFTEANAAIADAIKAVEFRFVPPDTVDNSEVAGELESASKAYAEAIARASGKTKNVEPESWQERMESILNYSTWCPAALTTETGNCSMGQSIVALVINGAADGSGGTGLVNPIIAVKNIGDWMLTVADSYFSMGLVKKYAPAAHTVLADAGKGITGLLGMDISGKGGEAMTAIMLGMLALGGFMSVFYPLTPFVIWIGAVVQYFVIFFEGLVGMPLAAFSHLDASDSEGLGARTEAGWLFILNVAFRPILMVAGFLGGCTLLIAMGTVIARLFLPAMANAQGNSITGLVSIFLFLASFYGLNVTLAHLCFNMTYLLPDQVLGLIGKASSEAMGRDVHDHHGRMSSEGGSAVNAVAAAVAASTGMPVASAQIVRTNAEGEAERQVQVKAQDKSIASQNPSLNNE